MNEVALGDQNPDWFWLPGSGAVRLLVCVGIYIRHNLGHPSHTLVLQTSTFAAWPPRGWAVGAEIGGVG